MRPPLQRRDSPPGGTPPPASVAPQVDAALGKAVRAWVAKLVPPLLVAIASAAVAGYLQLRALSDQVQRLAADAAEQRTSAAQEREKRLELTDYIRRDAENDRCRDQQLSEALEDLTPAPDRMEKATKPRAWRDRCPPRPSGP